MNAWHWYAGAASWLWWDKCLCRAGSSNMPSYMPVISLRPSCMPGYMSLAPMRPHSLSIPPRFQMQCLLLWLVIVLHFYTVLYGHGQLPWCYIDTERITKSNGHSCSLPHATQRMIKLQPISNNNSIIKCKVELQPNTMQWPLMFRILDHTVNQNCMFTQCCKSYCAVLNEAKAV